MTHLADPTRFCSILTLVSLITSTLAFPTSRKHDASNWPSTYSKGSNVTWSTCPPTTGLPNILQCARLSVPIDWDAPSGPHFDLGLVKLSATPSNSTSKVKYLFVNPGGPGGRTSEFVTAIALGAVRSDALLASFDIIGVDPRGVGLSSQVQCNMSIFAERVSLFPQSEDEFERLVDKNRRFEESCRELTGPLFQHLDTISSAKDHEAVRVALGSEPINFLGLSYGSQLGAQYAALFPTNIRTLALDGILLHSQSEATNLFTETLAYELALHHFFKWASKNESSALKGQDVEALWTGLLTNATESPLPAPSCNGTNCAIDVNAEEIRFNAHHYLTFPGADKGLGVSWEQLSSALFNASQGDASAFSNYYADPTPLSFQAIGCLDWTHNADSLSKMLAKQALVETYAPLTRGATQMWALQHGCIGWPVKVKNPPKKLDIQTNATILLTSSTSDPSTGFPWALGLLEEIRNAVLVTRAGDGHTSLPLGGETAEIIVDYLITGKAPKKGLVTSS